MAAARHILRSPALQRQARSPSTSKARTGALGINSARSGRHRLDDSAGTGYAPCMIRLPFVLATCLTVHAAFAEGALKDAALPDPTMTPGAVDRTVTLSQICNDTTKHRRPRTTAVCDQVFAAYSIPPADRYHYESDQGSSLPLAKGIVRLCAFRTLTTAREAVV